MAPPKDSKDPWLSASESSKGPALKPNPVPPYPKRSGFVPRKPEDFGDGGAFPEIHVAQYPLGMGHKDQKPGSKNLPLTVDSQRKVAFVAIVKQNENASKNVYSQHKDLVPKMISEEERESDELQTEIEESSQRTKEALENIVNVPTQLSESNAAQPENVPTQLSESNAAQPENVPTQLSESKFIKYRPLEQSAAFNSGAQERIIHMMEMPPMDLLEPPKFKHKRVPKAPGSPHVPVMQSPPSPVTVKDQQDWIPHCISNRKNPIGYTIPLDKRLAADGRGLQEVQINDNLAKLSEALYVAEQKAREAVAMRSKVQRELMLKERDRKEQEVRALAKKALSERTGMAPAPGAPVSADKSVVDDDTRVEEQEMRTDTREEKEQRMEGEKLHEKRQREREEERRSEARGAAMGKKSKITRDKD